MDKVLTCFVISSCKIWAFCWSSSYKCLANTFNNIKEKNVAICIIKSIKRKNVELRYYVGDKINANQQPMKRKAIRDFQHVASIQEENRPVSHNFLRNILISSVRWPNHIINRNFQWIYHENFMQISKIEKLGSFPTFISNSKKRL